jgi:hypothetical protein
MGKRALLLSMALAVAGCVTDIHPPDHPNVPSKAPFEQYTNIVVLPIAVLHSDGDSGDQRAIEGMQNGFSVCIKASLPTSHPEATKLSTYPPSTLLVEPIIEDMTKKTIGERLMWGPLAGSSAALMQVKFTDLSNDDLLAAPTFYAKRGSWQLTDNELMWEVVKQACAYAAANRLGPRR